MTGAAGLELVRMQRLLERQGSPRNLWDTGHDDEIVGVPSTGVIQATSGKTLNCVFTSEVSEFRAYKAGGTG